ncbi:Protein-serine O-palmitoleoyltransferase porcupine [Nymphon striatum]|nr:Protein-serine O-palmitoleoyltransferase porcupine [Nymphon striatum]
MEFDTYPDNEEYEFEDIYDDEYLWNEHLYSEFSDQQSGPTGNVLTDLFSNCITYVLSDGGKIVSKILVLCFILRVSTLLSNVPRWFIHITSCGLGIVALYQHFEYLGAYVIFLALSCYLIFFMTHQMKYHWIFLSCYCVLFLFICEFFVLDAVNWHKLRGIQMVLVMRVISVSLDHSNSLIPSVPSLPEYLGYTLCVGTLMFGPWISFNDYVCSLTQTQFNFRWLLSVFLSILACFGFLILSSCGTHYLLGDIESWKWFAVYRDALSFRSSHYFISYLSQATALTVGLNSRETAVSKPLYIEIPRSLVEVVVNWHIPMHRWLKNYVFKVAKPWGTFIAVLSTYATSALLHGLNFQLAAVLFSLGFFTYTEYVLRNKISQAFNTCTLAHSCQDKCKHKNKWNHPFTLLINVFFGLLAVVNLAYLGVMFDTSSKVAEENSPLYQYLKDTGYSDLIEAEDFSDCTKSKVIEDAVNKTKPTDLFKTSIIEKIKQLVYPVEELKIINKKFRTEFYELCCQSKLICEDDWRLLSSYLETGLSLGSNCSSLNILGVGQGRINHEIHLFHFSGTIKDAIMRIEDNSLNTKNNKFYQLPLSEDIDNMTNYLAGVPLSQFELKDKLDESEKENTILRVSNLKLILERYQLQQSELLTRLILSHFPENFCQHSEMYRKLDITWKNISYSASIISKLLEENCEAYDGISKSYHFHKCFLDSDTTSKRPVATRADESNNRVHTCVHSVYLHLQAALGRVREFESILDEVKANHDNTLEEALKVSQILQVVMGELKACSDCVEEGFLLINQEMACPKDSIASDNSIDVIKSKNLLQTIIHPWKCDETVIGDPLIEEQVFEGVIEKNEEEYIQSNYGELTDLTEQMLKKKQEAEDAVKLYRELKNVLKLRASEAQLKEEKILKELKNNHSVENKKNGVICDSENISNQPVILSVSQDNNLCSSSSKAPDEKTLSILSDHKNEEKCHSFHNIPQASLSFSANVAAMAVAKSQALGIKTLGSEEIIGDDSSDSD